MINSHESRPQGPVFPRIVLAVLILSMDANAQNPAQPGGPDNHDSRAERGPNRFEKPFLANKLLNSYYFDRTREAGFNTVYFPPTPPPLNSEVPLLARATGGNPAPIGLEPFAGDWFYPLLARRLSRNELTKNSRDQLQSYMTARTGLQNELRAKITEVKRLPPTERDEALSHFIETQKPAIDALEEQTDKIAAGLRRTDVLGSSADYIGDPSGELKAAKESNNPRREADALKVSAFFTEGLSAAQRRLLFASAIELSQEAASAPFSPTAPREWLFSLSPEPARIPITRDLPAPLAKKISDYVSEKRSLKVEICDALMITESAARLARIAALASDQQNRLTTLEDTAEEIRRQLNHPKTAGPSAAPSLPADLADRITAYRQRKVEVLKTLYAMLTRPGDSSLTDPEHQKNPEPATASWLHDDSTRTIIRPTQLRTSAGEFEAAQKKLLDALNLEQAEIRKALALHFRETNQPTDRKSLDDLLKDFEWARQNQEIRDKYRDYQDAVLMPGLSPGQRRLLFAGAVEHLALPLPNAEEIP